jgi:hypothetical protein
MILTNILKFKSSREHIRLLLTYIYLQLLIEVSKGFFI